MFTSAHTRLSSLFCKASTLSALALMLILGSTTSVAEQKESFGEYEIHYSAFVSTFLTPEVAKQYGIVRSKAIGVVNISVLKKSDDGRFVPTSAQVEGLMTNDVQQQQHLGFRRIKEGKAIYYIAEIQFLEGEVLAFNISAMPEGHSKTLKTRFTQTFYNEK